MTEKEWSRESIEAALQGAIIAWQKRPDMGCKDCGKTAFEPTAFRKNLAGWEVESWSRPLSDGWLHLEEHVPEGASYAIRKSLLCPDCRAERSL